MGKHAAHPMLSGTFLALMTEGGTDVRPIPLRPPREYPER